MPQSRPVCFVDARPVDHPVFEAACGHDGCPSVVFHPICLSNWRAHREAYLARFGEVIAILFERRDFS